MLKTVRQRRVVVALLVAGLSLVPGRAARAAEISGFVGSGSPSEAWGTCWGGMLTITLFNIVHGEVEGAWQGGALSGTSVYTAAAKAYLGPSFGRFVPYAGIGAGVYHESLPIDDDQGTTGLLFVGAKLKFSARSRAARRVPVDQHAGRRAGEAPTPSTSCSRCSRTATSRTGSATRWTSRTPS